MSKAIVWSRDDCGYCVNAKSLLESKNIEFEERNLSGGVWTKEQLLAVLPDARSLPQIFLNDEHIGGYTQLLEKLK